MQWHEASALVAAVFAVFALLHSLLVTDAAKRLAIRLLGETFVRAFYRLAYTLISLATAALAVYLILRIPDKAVFIPPLWLRLPFHLIQIAGAAMGAAAFRRMSVGEFLGAAQAWRYVSGKGTAGDSEGLRQSLVTDGVYGVVRHPQYLAGILIFTFNPYLTRNWLTVSLMADIYFVLGAFHEERRLIRRFGEEYRVYTGRVPRFVPRLF